MPTKTQKLTELAGRPVKYGWMDVSAISDFFYQPLGYQYGYHMVSDGGTPIFLGKNFDDAKGMIIAYNDDYMGRIRKIVDYINHTYKIWYFVEDDKGIFYLRELSGEKRRVSYNMSLYDFYHFLIRKQTRLDEANKNNANPI